MKVTVIVQLEPAAKVLIGDIGQLFVTVKSLAFAPLAAMLEMVWATPSLFVRVTLMGRRLVEPWFWVPKLRLLGDTLIGATVGTTPAAALKYPV